VIAGGTAFVGIIAAWKRAAPNNFAMASGPLENAGNRERGHIDWKSSIGIGPTQNHRPTEIATSECKAKRLVNPNHCVNGITAFFQTGQTRA
jgi:hypothetical protein